MLRPSTFALACGVLSLLRCVHGQCALSALSSHLETVQAECCYSLAHDLASRLEDNLLGYWNFEVRTSKIG